MFKIKLALEQARHFIKQVLCSHEYILQPIRSNPLKDDLRIYCFCPKCGYEEWIEVDSKCHKN